MSIPGQPGNPSHSEECDDDNETLPQPSNHSEATNEEDDASSSQNQNETGCNDSEQLIQNAKDKFGPANRQHSDEYDRSDGSDVQPAKRRRLNEFEEDSDYSHNRSIIRPSESNRSDQSSQTSHPYAPTQGVYSREICRSVSVPSVFERVSSGRHQDETSVFLPSVTHYSVQPDEREEQQVEGTEDEGVEMVQTDEHQEVRANEQQVKARKEPYRFEPFDPFKYLAEIDKSPVNPKHRITTFLGNRVYRKRQQKLRRGVIGRLFFPSPQKPNKSLDTRNESSQRPSFNRAVYRDGCDERIPPEYGGSPFYNGLTRYGGASAANTLSTHFTAPRSSPGQDNSVLIRNPMSSTSRKRPRLDQESNAPVMSSTSQRILEIVDAYDVARKDDKKRLELPSCASITQELDEILSRPHLSTSPQMLQLIRQQNLASIVCEREEHVPYPPIAPLIDVMPLYLYHKTDTTEQRETAASDEHRTATGELRGNVESTVERNVVSEESAQPAVSQHQILDDVRTSEVTELPPALENETAHTATLLTNSVTQERDQTLGDTANANCLTVERNAISFDDPICLGNSNQEFETVVDNVPTFTFAEPQLLGQHRQRPITSLRQLLAESVSDWENDMGLVHNETHQLLSVAGKNVNKCQKNATASKSATHAAKENFTTIVYAQLSCWECNICSVRNEPASAVCACCEAEKPTLAANRSGKTANSKKNETVSVSPFSNLNSIANQQIPNELMQQTVSSDASATGTGTTQTPKPSSSAGFTAPCTGSLQSLVAGTDSIFPKQQRNMSFASGVTFSASPTVSKINQKTTLSGGSSFASEFGAKTNTTNINASSNNNNASVGNVSWKNNDTNPNPFGSFGRPHAEFSSIFSSSTPNSPEFQRNETAHKAVEAPGRNQTVAFATDLKLNPNADVNGN
uniref:RanBP2-type domain-containing protein n=1 Tax=Anopheles culicifacies TaxID=139723 RepID=A0A182M4Q1_9DIPT